jgi:hypothetical protein
VVVPVPERPFERAERPNADGVARDVALGLYPEPDVEQVAVDDGVDVDPPRRRGTA